MARRDDLAAANKNDAFMWLLKGGPIGRKTRLYAAYQKGGWVEVHGELVEMLRAAEKAGDKEADRLAQALRDVLRYQTMRYKLGQCRYVPADPPPKDASPEEIEEELATGNTFSREAEVLDDSSAKWFAHYFLYATDILYKTGERGPKWCPEHSGAARVRDTRKKKIRERRAGKFI